MEEVEKLTSLKKAYADIILNTAKEAAARIMMSEKRALSFQQDLSTIKEESVRMLLRLKQMMDSKVQAAEIVSVNQQRKIEELEAQLHEAEDIVRDLREEVHGMREELEKMKSKQLQTDEALLKNGHRDNSGIELCGSLSRIPIPHRQCSMSSLMDQRLYCFHDSNGSDFPSIITRRKHTKLYKNGCTQRIHASENSLLDGRLPFLAEGEPKDKKLEQCKSRDSDSVEISESEIELLQACMMENATSKSMRLENEPTLTNKGHDLDNNGLPSTNADSQRSDSACMDLAQPKNDKFLKYTFARKRKRDSLRSSQDVSADKCTSKWKSGENTKRSSILPNSSMMAESSRDSRRIAQVARQLISLSEKRWR